jgi:hypothetical protein
VIWAVPLVLVALAGPGTWAWYISGRQLAAKTQAQQWRMARLGVAVSAGVGVAIFVLGVVAFVLTDGNWLALVPLWSFGLLHLSLLALMVHRIRKQTGDTKPGG